LSLLILASGGWAQEPAAQLRYDLRIGDHLTYREIFERAGTNSHYGYDFHYRKEWTNHVLVTAAERGGFNIGFQRNRTQAELLRFQSKAKDGLETERARFAELLASSSPHFAEANRLTPLGWPLVHWQAARESHSQILFEFHELAPLPAQPVRPGDAWDAPSLLGLAFRAAGWDRLQDQDCLRVLGDSEPGNLHLRFWFCPASGTLARLEFEGNYPVFGGEFREKLTFELVEQRRGEEIEDWLDDPDLQQGVLASFLLSDSVPVEPLALYALLETPDVPVQRHVLALAYRFRLPPPPVERLAVLLQSKDARVRTLSVRALEYAPKQSARGLIERGLKDEDYFVRQAALAWVRSRLPLEQALAVNDAEEARAAWDSLENLPATNPSPSDNNTLSKTQCGAAVNWATRALHTRRLSGQPPGATIRAMSSEDFPGWPYIVHVPEDYRGDEPFPLLIYLSGDAGRAVDGLNTAEQTVPNLGYLTLFPQGGEYWWHDRPTAMATELLSEVLHSFNVDTNRVYLAGISNGGTAVFRYGSWWSDRLAAGVSLMGAGIYNPENDPEPPLVVNLLQLPLFFVHGKDDEIINANATTETVKALRRLNPTAPVSMQILEGRGHDILLDTDEGLTVPFLQQHVRDPFPRTVIFQVEDLRFPRRFWVEILDKKKGPAEVQATINDDNTIRVDTHRVKRLRLLLRGELFQSEAPVRVLLNGKEVFTGALPEDCDLLHRSWQEVADPFLAYSAELTFEVAR
jgi:hypothetical protein